MDEECLPQPHERPRVDGPRLEARRVGVVVLAALRQVQPRAPAEPRRREEGQVSHPEPARRERAMQPFVTEGHHGIRAELDDIDGDLPERLRGVDDGDRSGVAGETACFADRQHVPGLARDERDEECAGSALHAAANLFEETIRVAVPRDLAQAIAELVEARRNVGHAVMMPRIARPAAKSAANPSATDCPRAARSRTTEAASGSARASANPYRTCSASAGGRRNAKTTKPSAPCATEAITAIAIAPRKPGVGPLFRTPRNRPQRPTTV